MVDIFNRDGFPRAAMVCLPLDHVDTACMAPVFVGRGFYMGRHSGRMALGYRNCQVMLVAACAGIDLAYDVVQATAKAMC